MPPQHHSVLLKQDWTVPHLHIHPWGCMCSAGSNVNETARIIFLGWTNQTEVITVSLASLEVGYKGSWLWPPPISTLSLSKLKDLWFSFGDIQDFSLQLSLFFYFAFCQYLLQGAIRADMRNLEGETHRCHSILELKLLMVLRPTKGKQFVQVLEFHSGPRQVCWSWD